MSFASPGVTIKEVDLTTSLNVSDQNIGVVALAATQGPVNQLTYITSEAELVSTFGKPTDNNYEAWFSAAQFIAYGGIVAVIRPMDSNNIVGLKNANTDGLTNILIENSLDHLQNEIAPSYKFAAKTPGSVANNLKVVVVDHGADQILTVSGATQNNTTLAVTSSAGFSNGDYVKVDDEYFLVSAVASGTLTVTGAQLGTAGAGSVNHAAGATLTKWTFAESGTTTPLAEANGTPELSSTEAFITVTSVTGFAVNDFVKIKRVPTGGTAGTTFEYAKITAIDSETNILEVLRGQLGTTAIAFDDDVNGGESAVTVSVIKMNFAATTPVTTLATAYPTYAIGTFTGAVGGIVKSGSKIGWVHSIVGNTVNVILKDSTSRFVAGDTLYNADGTTAIGSIQSTADYYSTLQYAPGLYWSSIAPQPGTSGFALQRNAQFDEFHLVILDEDGGVTGVPNTIVEKFAYLSKANDGKSTDGEVKYWKKVLEQRSNFIYAGTNFVGSSKVSLEPVAGSNQVSRSADNTVVNSLFDIFASNATPVLGFSLANGQDYQWVSQSNVIENALTSAYDLVGDTETFNDIDFLIPGSISAVRASKLIDIAETRKDCMAVISPRRSDVITSMSSADKTTNVIEFFNLLPSSSFVIFDSGYKYIYDKYNDQYRYIPCAADVAGLCVNTTINSETWFSPAGYNRGNLKNALRLAYNPKKAERDRLYISRVNPIVSFPGQGIVLFGDKTGLATPSAFDRINVRRLFIELEKVVGRLAKFQLFEINDENTRGTFRAIVEPYLRDVQARRGIYEFLVVCDGSNNPPDAIDRNEFYAEIYVKPARSINFITLTFIATRTGVSFSEIVG